MAITESQVLTRVKLAASKMGFVLWRNNRGVLKDSRGRSIRYGVGPNGASDLIGYRKVTISEDMVGKQVAIFTAIEVKRPGGRASEDQKHFVEVVAQHGGITAIVDDEKKLLTL